MVGYIYSKFRRLRHASKASLGYIERPCLEDKIMMWHSVVLHETGPVWMVWRMTWTGWPGVRREGIR